MTSSRISGFYNLPIDERHAKITDSAPLTPEDLLPFADGGLTPDSADHMIENVIGTHSLPLGIGLNFQVNGRDVLVPFAIEEPSVVAGASFMAKLARAGGGFQATTSAPEMIGQMQVLDVDDVASARLKIYEFKAALLAEAEEIDPILNKFGGGARDLEVRIIEDSPIGAFLVIHLIYDVRDAMGANAVNTACERLACPTWQTGVWLAHAAPFPSRIWRSMITPDRRCVTASSRPGLSRLPILTAPPPTTKEL